MIKRFNAKQQHLANEQKKPSNAEQKVIFNHIDRIGLRILRKRETLKGIETILSKGKFVITFFFKFFKRNIKMCANAKVYLERERNEKLFE